MKSDLENSPALNGRGDETASLSTDGAGIGGELVAALADRDAQRLGSCLDREVRLRALVPSGYQEHRGSTAVISRFMSWFEEPDSIQVLDKSEHMVVDRLRLRYKFRVLYTDGVSEIIEQSTICDIRDSKITGIDLLCSGYRPERTNERTEIHRFEAGELGCGSGLPLEFRRQIAAVPVGSTLEVSTRDPSAKEDLPSLARLLGHRVVSVRVSPDGSTVVAVQRAG